MEIVCACFEDVRKIVYEIGTKYEADICFFEDYYEACIRKYPELKHNQLFQSEWKACVKKRGEECRQAHKEAYPTRTLMMNPTSGRDPY
jgi:hypothetical protein